MLSVILSRVHCAELLHSEYPLSLLYKWCGLCVTEKQATDAVCCGPGASVRPHDWMDSCAVFISQKGLLLSALTSHSALL